MKHATRYAAATVAVLALAGLAGQVVYAQPDGADRYDTATVADAAYPQPDAGATGAWSGGPYEFGTVSAASDVNIGADAVQVQPEGGWVYSPQGWQPDWMD